MIVFTYLCVALASICNAIMDICEHKYGISIFNTGKPLDKYWYKAKNSWRNKYIDGDSKKGRVKMSILGRKFTTPVQITDAWHYYKMWMIIFLCYGITTYTSNKYDLIHFVMLGVTWNTTFTVFYHQVLLRDSPLKRLLSKKKTTS